MGKKRIHADIAASTSESPATIAMFTHDSMPHYPDTTSRCPRSPRSERVVRIGTNSPTRTLFDGKEGNKNYKHLGTELLHIVLEARDKVPPPAAICLELEKSGAGIPFLQPDNSRSLPSTGSFNGS
jgi:hypothetical protein